MSIIKECCASLICSFNLIKPKFLRIVDTNQDCNKFQGYQRFLGTFHPEGLGAELLKGGIVIFPLLSI